MSEYVYKPTPRDYHFCETPDTKGVSLNTIWRCDCGQFYVLDVKFFGSALSHWKRVSRRRARSLIKDAEFVKVLEAKRKAKKQRPLFDHGKDAE